MTLVRQNILVVTGSEALTVLVAGHVCLKPLARLSKLHRRQMTRIHTVKTDQRKLDGKAIRVVFMLGEILGNSDRVTVSVYIVGVFIDHRA